MLEGWEAFLSSIWKMETIKKPAKKARTKLEVPMEAAISWKKEQWNNARLKNLKREIVNPRRFQKIHVSIVKAHESSQTKDHEDHKRKQRHNSMTQHNWVHKFSCASSGKNSGCKSGSGQGMEDAWDDSSLEVWENPKQERGFIWKHTETKKARFATLTVICHLKKFAVGKLSKSSRAPTWHCKRRLWGLCSLYWTRLVCVSNDCRKVMDVIARVPDCGGQTARAVSAYAQVKIEDAPNDTNGQNHGPTSKIQWFLLNEICMDIHLLVFCGKDNSMKFWWDLTGEQYRIGNVRSSTRNKDYSCRYTWTTTKWLEESRIWFPCGRSRWKKLILSNKLHFLIIYIWDAFSVNASRMKQSENNARRCSSHVFLLE